MSTRSISSTLQPIAWGAVVLWGGWILYQATQLPQPEATSAPNPTEARASTTEPTDIPPETWTVFQDTSKAVKPVATDQSRGRYRLAGTFLSFSGDGSGQEVRKAIIDDAGEQSQSLVQEGDSLGSWEVEKIRRESVVLQNTSGETLELHLSFSAAPPTSTSTGPSILKPNTFEDMPALETSRFGKRIADNRWVLRREELMAYYQELLDNPSRMASLFTSLQDYREEGDLNGFQVQMVGEQDLFAAMGLEEGDIIREVNSIRMTSARRSEYLVKEFIQGRLNAVVFDVERAGERQKLIQLIR